jgi:hypothetical protein
MNTDVDPAPRRAESTSIRRPIPVTARKGMRRRWRRECTCINGHHAAEARLSASDSSQLRGVLRERLATWNGSTNFFK